MTITHGEFRKKYVLRILPGVVHETPKGWCPRCRASKRSSMIYINVVRYQYAKLRFIPGRARATVLPTSCHWSGACGRGFKKRRLLAEINWSPSYRGRWGIEYPSLSVCTCMCMANQLGNYAPTMALVTN